MPGPCIGLRSVQFGFNCGLLADRTCVVTTQFGLITVYPASYSYIFPPGPILTDTVALSCDNFYSSYIAIITILSILLVLFIGILTIISYKYIAYRRFITRDRFSTVVNIAKQALYRTHDVNVVDHKC